MSLMKSIVTSLLFTGSSSHGFLSSWFRRYFPKAAHAYATRWHVSTWHVLGHPSDPPYAIERKRVLMRSEFLFPPHGVRRWDSADLSGTAVAFIVHITRRAVTPLDAGELPFVGRIRRRLAFPSTTALGL